MNHLQPTASLIPDGYRLRLPGPTAVPQRVRNALALPVVSHRGPEFRAILADAIEMLRPVLGTKSDIFMIASSGTGAMEAALANVIAPADAVLVVTCGQFGERFINIAETMGAQVDKVEVPWGEAPDPGAVAEQLKQRSYRAVICVHNESSTGVVTDVAAIGRAVARTDALLIVDCVSGAGGIELKMDEWSIDILAVAAHKALMCPPGLGILAVSEKALRVIETANTVPRFYFDLRKAKAASLKGETAFTPPEPLIMGLREALLMIHEEGFANVLERHRRMSAALQAGCVALGLPMLPPGQAQSPTVVVALVPEGFDSGRIVRHMYAQYRTVIAGQRTKLSGRVIRFGTMGAISADDVLTDLEQLEATLRELGPAVGRNAGTQAARAVLSQPVSA
jgi:aspartate aminotransferase-like enzyme